MKTILIHGYSDDVLIVESADGEICEELDCYNDAIAVTVSVTAEIFAEAVGINVFCEYGMSGWEFTLSNLATDDPCTGFAVSVGPCPAAPYSLQLVVTAPDDAVAHITRKSEDC